MSLQETKPGPRESPGRISFPVLPGGTFIQQKDATSLSLQPHYLVCNINPAVPVLCPGLQSIRLQIARQAHTALTSNLTAAHGIRIVIPTLQMRKLSLRTLKQLPNWQSEDFNAVCLTLKPMTERCTRYSPFDPCPVPGADFCGLSPSAHSGVWRVGGTDRRR